MKIGIFDSGLGGLLLAGAIRQALPDYDYLYLGDTKNLPYGNRSQEEIYRFTHAAFSFLFQHDCGLVIIACNTASAEALRRIQVDFPRTLGVLIPAAEIVSAPVGVLATSSTVASGAFVREIEKLHPELPITQVATPLLVPMIESGELENLPAVLEEYLTPIRESGCRELILGCTHYVAIKDQIRDALPGVKIISQDEVVPEKLREYLSRHQDLELSKNGSITYYLTTEKSGYEFVTL